MEKTPHGYKSTVTIQSETNIFNWQLVHDFFQRLKVLPSFPSAILSFFTD